MDQNIHNRASQNFNSQSTDKNEHEILDRNRPSKHSIAHDVIYENKRTPITSIIVVLLMFLPILLLAV
jgi:hypothetical protein